MLGGSAHIQSILRVYFQDILHPTLQGSIPKYLQQYTANMSQSRTSSTNIAVFGTPSSLITPRYIPEQFNGIATKEKNDGINFTPQIISNKESIPFP